MTSKVPFGPHGQEGSMVLELSLVMPLLLAALLGIFTGGSAYSRQIGVAEAVREGARYGATRALGTTGTATADFEAGVKDRVVQVSGGYLTAADVCVKLVLPSGATDCGVSDPPGASGESTVHLVKVSASKAATIQFFFFSKDSTISASLAARYERDTG